MKRCLLFAACMFWASAGQAAATIDFESYAEPSDFFSFTNHGATFTPTGSTSVLEISSYGKNYGTGGGKVLCPYLSSNNYCGGSFNVTFATAVSDLQFYFGGDNSTAAVSVQGFLNNVLLGTIFVNGDGVTTTAQLVNLSSFGALNKISITGGANDVGGFAYDNFTFTPVVPEPSAWALMLLGFSAIGAAMHQRKRIIQAE